MSLRPTQKRRAKLKIENRSATVYWLVPAEPYRKLFREIIRILAKQFDAPRFEPHVTLFLAQDRHRSKTALSRRSAAPIRLRIRGIGFSSEFTKTLFVRFAPRKSLDRLIIDLGGKGTPVCDPHVSLVYKKMSILAKRELAATINLPFREVVFDSIKVVRCISPTQTRADVESWRVLATKRLR